MIAPSRPRLEALQLAQLRALLGQVRGPNRFYTPSLEQAGLDANVASLDQFRRSLPTTTKDMLVADHQAHPPFGSNLTFPLHRYCRFSQTSGTSGSPLRWLDTSESWQWMLDNWRQVFTTAGIGAGDRLMLAFSFGPFLGFWTAYEAACSIGALCLPGGGLSSAARLTLIRDNAATALCCTPTYALRLAEVAAEIGMELSGTSVRTIIVAGEPGGSLPAVRQRIRSAWGGAMVFDHHGMTEVGPVSYQQPDRPGVLVVIESAYLTEVLDPATLEPVHAGHTGELVLTTLGRTGSPLLRYRTGDLVNPIWLNGPGGEPILGLEGGIIGRVDDMVTVRGVNLFPSAVDDILRTFDAVSEYRVELEEQDTLAEVRLLLEPAATCHDPGDLCRRVERALRDTFSLRIAVNAVPRGRLPRQEHKARRWARIRRAEPGAT